MRKVFILGGSQLQIDLILEAKKMFFYTIVLDGDKNCIGSKWCDEFLHIDFSNKELVLEKALAYKIDMILTSATELGNVSACYVGEAMGLNTNTYETALLTTNKLLMKETLVKSSIPTANYKIESISNFKESQNFPIIIKPIDSSGGRGLSFVNSKEELNQAIKKISKYSKEEKFLVEEYIQGEQYSIETISCKGHHSIIAITHEFFREVPNIIEKKHYIPANLNTNLKERISKIVENILNSFKIKFGACHIELKITSNNEIYIIELASRTGGMRTEMINLSYGINFSQLLLLSSLGIEFKNKIEPSRGVWCKFIVDTNMFEEYLEDKNKKNIIIFEPNHICNIKQNFMANNLHESLGYYYVIGEEYL